MTGTVLNLIFFKLGWIACILFAASGQPALALLCVAAVVAMHLLRVAVPVKEALLLVFAGLMGLAWESFMVASGLIEYPGAAHNIAPYWIVAMWVLFATTFNHGFKWIKRHWLLAAAFGAIGGPIAFASGQALGAAQFADTTAALTAIGAGWALMLPLLALVADTIIDSDILEPPTRQAPDESPAPTSLLDHLGVKSRHV